MKDSPEWEKIQRLLKNGDYSLCIVSLEQLLSLHPKHPVYLYWLSYALIQIHHPIAAMEALKQLCEAHPQKKDSNIDTALLIAHFDATCFVQAECIADEGMNLYPTTPEFFRYKGLLVSRKDPSAGSSFFTRAHLLAPKEYLIPKSIPEESILETALSWLPHDAQTWIRTFNIIFEQSPSKEILNREDFPHHPLIPFLLYDNTLYIFLCNLRYQQHQSPTSVLFEQLLSMWNQYFNALD